MKRKLLMAVLAAVGLSVLLAAPAGAQEAEAAPATQYVLDNLWVFIAGVLVFLMQAGFAMVEATVLLAALMANFRFERQEDPMPVAHLTVRARDGIWLEVSRRMKAGRGEEQSVAGAAAPVVGENV